MPTTTAGRRRGFERARPAVVVLLVVLVVLESARLRRERG
jgi:hypothetical protein